MQKDVIYCKECSKMEEVEENSVDLVISGPPYWDYIDYDTCTLNANDRSSHQEAKESYNVYLHDLKQWHAECYRVLRPGRYCIVNVGTITKNGRCYPLPYHTVSALEEIGFVFQHDIIWHKVAGGRKHARSAIQNPYPGYYVPNNRTEFILVFRKQPEVRFFKHSGDYKSKENEILIDDLFTREIANNVWYFLPNPSRKHPCPFPPEIPYRLIQLYSLKGETVLDPFMGIGTTARAARMLGRHFIGYEAQQKFIDIATEELNQPLNLREPTICEYNSLRRNRKLKKEPCRRDPMERKSLQK